jgi:hypothetical protein
MMELTGLIILVVLVSIAVNGPGSQEARCRAEIRRADRLLRKLRKERAKAQRP